MAGPDVAEINLRIPPDLPVSKANIAFVKYWKRLKRRAARRSIFKRTTPPLNVLGGYKFPNAPQIDLSPSPAVLSPAIPAELCTGDGLEIPPFLQRRKLENVS